MAAFWYQGLTAGMLQIEARSNDWSWTLPVENTTATTTSPCGGSITLWKRSGSSIGYTSFLGGGSCTIRLTRAAPAVGDVLEGTFSGLLTAFGDNSMTATITNGRFRIPRGADRPAAP